jgi:hypothetical protein
VRGVRGSVRPSNCPTCPNGGFFTFQKTWAKTKPCRSLGIFSENPPRVGGE